MADPDLDRYRANRQDEIDSATVYRAMADAAPAGLAEVYRRLAETEEPRSGRSTSWRRR